MDWFQHTSCYHIYPLGCFDCEQYHIDEVHADHRILQLIDWIPHLQELAINAIYLGPIFESCEHGYDTIDYFTLDHRLGTNQDFQTVCKKLHEAGIHVILDGVFHHVGRDFFAFQDLLKNREHSQYINWFEGIRFDQDTPYHDGFSYDCWEGHYNLIKLNLRNEDVLDYLFSAIAFWIDEFQIDGLRLDAANRIDFSFFHKLRAFTKSKKADFFLLGEVIHGDYSRWANDKMLDATTNYEAYKGLYSSFNSRNFFEIAYSFNREFGDFGMYRNLPLYNFVDNHDVNRIIDTLQDSKDLYNLYTLLFTMPGIPSIYYGSEWGIHGKKGNGTDAPLRPAIHLQTIDFENNPLYKWICFLSHLRNDHPALINGDYAQVIVRNEQFVYQRTCAKERFCVACNLDEQDYTLSFSSDLPMYDVVNKLIYTPVNEEITVTIPAKSSTLVSSIVEDANIQTEDALLEEMMVMNPEAEHEIQHDEIIINGIYRHFKGNLYKVVDTATHSEDLTTYVIYRQMYGDFKLWIRPLDMFLETIERNGVSFKRFQFMFKEDKE